MLCPSKNGVLIDPSCCNSTHNGQDTTSSSALPTPPLVGPSTFEATPNDDIDVSSSFDALFPWIYEPDILTLRDSIGDRNRLC